MAAISAVLSRFDAGSRVVAPDDVYTGVGTWLRDAEQRLSWIVTRVPVADTAAWIDASTDADLVWLESPSNPLLEVTDLAAVIPAAKRAGAFVAVDNTFATPVLQQPLQHGADVVVHSATKYIGGHADLLAGVAITIDETIHERPPPAPQAARGHARCTRDVPRAAGVAHAPAAIRAGAEQRPPTCRAPPSTPSRRHGSLPDDGGSRHRWLAAGSVP